MNQALSVLANIGVIFGILFLAIELRQNNSLLETQERAAFSDRVSESNSLIATNPELAEALAKPSDELTARERVQRRAFRTRVLRNQEFIFQEVPVSELPINSWRASLNREFNIQHWDQVKQEYLPEFVEFMDAQIRR